MAAGPRLRKLGRSWHERGSMSRRVALLFVLALGGACSSDRDARDGTDDAVSCAETQFEVRCSPKEGDIRTRLGCFTSAELLEGRTRLESGAGLQPHRRQDDDDIQFVDLQFEMPVDHSQPAAATFSYTISVRHIGDNFPVVVLSYPVSRFFGFELIRRFEAFANIVYVNPRYANWSDIPDTFQNLEQSADDLHVVASMLRQVYETPIVTLGIGDLSSAQVLAHQHLYACDIAGSLHYGSALFQGPADERVDLAIAEIAKEEATCMNADVALLRDMLLNKELVASWLEPLGLHLGRMTPVQLVEHMCAQWLASTWSKGTVHCARRPEADADLETKYLWWRERSDAYFNLSLWNQGGRQMVRAAALELGAPAAVVWGIEDLVERSDSHLQLAAEIPQSESHASDDRSWKEIQTWLGTDARNVAWMVGVHSPAAVSVFSSDRSRNVVAYFAPTTGAYADETTLHKDDAQELEALERSWLELER